MSESESALASGPASLCCYNTESITARPQHLNCEEEEGWRGEEGRGGQLVTRREERQPDAAAFSSHAVTHPFTLLPHSSGMLPPSACMF